MSMLKTYLPIVAAIFIAQPVLADEDMSDAKPCMSIVKPCLDAGYDQHGSDGKQFWKDCMRPILMGKSVSGVNVDAKEVKVCRAAKIKQLQQELNELKSVK